MFTPRHIQRSLATFGLGFALIAAAMTGTATARPIDQVPQNAEPQAPAQDLRSADARDAALRTGSLAGTPEPPQDLRSPDARDAAKGSPKPQPRVYWAYPRDTAPAPTAPVFPTYPVKTTPAPAAVDVEPADSGGIDWAPIALGLAGGILVSGLAVVLARRRPRLRTNI